MSTPTTIRVWQPGNMLVTVVTVSTPHGFSAHFQVYRVHEHHLVYLYGMKWRGEPDAIAQFDRFVKIHTDNAPVKMYRTYQARNAHLGAMVTNYIKARKAEGWDHSVAKREAHFFYGVGK